MSEVKQIYSGEDRYGAYLMLDSFRCAMPSAEVAQNLVLALKLHQAIENAAKNLPEYHEISIEITKDCGSVLLAFGPNATAVESFPYLHENVQSALETAIENAKQMEEFGGRYQPEVI